MLTVTVTVNGAPHPLPEGSTLADLVAALGAQPAALATAVNADFVPREQRAACVLQAGDAVTTFQPITGG